MISLTLDEVVATLQFLVQARRERQPLWQTFWMGGALREGTDATSAPIRADVVSPMAMPWGVALPWNLIVTVALADVSRGYEVIHPSRTGAKRSWSAPEEERHESRRVSLFLAPLRPRVGGPAPRTDTRCILPRSRRAGRMPL